MKFQKLAHLGITISLVVSLFAPSAFAATGVDAVVNVTVGTEASPEVPVSNAHVNMYEIVLVNNEYTGKSIATMSTGVDGKGAKFTVKPGQVVDFMGFASKEAAEKAITFVTKGVPPLKNFSLEDGVAGVCHTNGVDFNKKFEAQASTPCSTEMLVTIPDVAPAPKGKKVTYTVQVIEPVTNENLNKEPIVVPGTYVNMYEITVVNNVYTGKLLKTTSTGKNGKGAKFTVKPGQVVDFMGFSDKKLAKAAKAFVSNGVPPMKNFSPVYGPGLCHTNGADFNEKLLGSSDGTMCGKMGQVGLSN